MRGREPYIRASVFDGLVDFVAKEGLAIDVPNLLREFGLEPLQSFRSDTYIKLAPVSHLLERAAVLSGRPCFGLDYAAEYPVGASGSLGYLLTHAANMQDALANLVKYMPAFTSPMHIELLQDEDGVSFVEWMFPLEFTSAMPQYVSFALGTVIHRLRHIAGPAWVPLRVDLIHRELPCHAQYTALFGSRVRFEAAHNRMWLDAATLEISHTSPDERLYRTALLAGDSELAAHAARRPGQPDIIRDVRSQVEKILNENRVPDLDAVATGLGHDARKLQYMLDQLKTSFSDELSETRRLMAERMLTSTDMSMSEIALALGFAEMSSFTRACRNWFGLAPSKFRQRVRAEGVMPAKVHSASDDDTGAV